ncbi:hypothetical protein K439DRAFT_1633968 [Ramaria rubella]|nr:hypothetical protein K439DRAFT_1633968 [Ramaria rubella]
MVRGPPSSVSSFGTDILETHLTKDRFHVDFTPLDGDIILKSSDDVKFRTHTFILKLASGVFRTTLSLPQSPGMVLDESGKVIALSEDARTINAILRMICGMEIPPLDNFDDIEKVLLTANKWEMPGPPSIIHRMITPQALLDNPVRLYALACKVGWSEAAALAAAHTLDVDLQHEDIQPLLYTMESRDVLRLFELRTRRRDALLEFLLSFTVPGCLSHLPHSKGTAPTEHELSVQWQWKAFMFTVYIAMDRHPSAKTLLGPDSVLESDLEDMRVVKCPHFEGAAAFDVEVLEEALHTKIAELPRTIL